MAAGHVRNWSAFQHYKDRSPPWIKLHRALLDDFDFTSLPLASKALAPLIWLLAAETNDGYINLDANWLAWRLRMPLDEVSLGLTPLIERGFLVSDSAPLALRKQRASPEGETEGETEGEARASKRKKKTSGDVTLTAWMEGLNGADAIPADDSIFSWAGSVGIPREWIVLAWWSFESRYGAEGRQEAKEYTDWRKVFRSAVKEDWLKLWRHGRDGWELTPAGEAQRREMTA